jgi:hypothetical protein
MSLAFLVMHGLRGDAEIEVSAVRACVALLALFVDFYGEIRATELAHPAANAEIGMLGPDLAALFQGEDVPGTEGHADVAALAIPLPHDMHKRFLRLVVHMVVDAVYSSIGSLSKANIRLIYQRSGSNPGWV